MRKKRALNIDEQLKTEKSIQINAYRSRSAKLADIATVAETTCEHSKTLKIYILEYISVTVIQCFIAY